jgi:hypothetical protein
MASVLPFRASSGRAETSALTRNRIPVGELLENHAAVLWTGPRRTASSNGLWVIFHPSTVRAVTSRVNRTEVRLGLDFSCGGPDRAGWVGRIHSSCPSFPLLWIVAFLPVAATRPSSSTSGETSSISAETGRRQMADPGGDVSPPVGARRHSSERRILKGVVRSTSSPVFPSYPLLSARFVL